jgi:urease accessory protein
MASLELLQLADANFPSGSFAFSNGLESLAKLGYVKSMEGFRQYLACHLEQIASAESPFLNSAFAAATLPARARTVPAPGPARFPEAFAAIAREWDAWVFLPSPRRASLSQGQAWSRAMEASRVEPAVHAVRPWFAENGLPLHFLMAFAATLAAAGFALADAQDLLLHMALRDQLGAAVRLGLLGSLQAQKLHREHIAVGECLRTARALWTHADAVRAAPMIDLGQASHAHLYSKLFQS